MPNESDSNPSNPVPEQPKPRTFLRGEDGMLREVQVVPDPLGHALSEAAEMKLKTVKVIGSEKEDDVFKGLMFTIPGDTEFIEIKPETDKTNPE